MNKDELDIILIKAKELLNDKKAIKEELEKEQITIEGIKHYAKSEVKCGNYSIKMRIKLLDGDSNE